jgi:hypothetical protein
VHKQKKEIKDNKTVIECLRKQIAFSKLTGKAVVHLDQFVTLPRAICDTSGIPEKGKKIQCYQNFEILVWRSFYLKFTTCPHRTYSHHT